MRIGILGAPNGYHAKAIDRAAIELGHESHRIDFAGLRASMAFGRQSLQVGDIDLFHLDRVIVRSVPGGSLEQVIVRVDVLHRLAESGVPVLNPPRAIEACVDKYLATARLAAAGLPVPQTSVCERADDALQIFGELGGKAVVKPIFGSEGKGILFVETEAMAYRVFRSLEQLGAVAVVQEYLDHPGYDVRALVLGGEVVAGMRRHSAMGDFRSNVSQGGRPEAMRIPADWAELAVRAAETLGAPLAGVDLLPTRSGEVYVLEANSSPGFKALSESTGFDAAKAIVQYATSASW